MGAPLKILIQILFTVLHCIALQCFCGLPLHCFALRMFCTAYAYMRPAREGERFTCTGIERGPAMGPSGRRRRRRRGLPSWSVAVVVVCRRRRRLGIERCKSSRAVV